MKKILLLCMCIALFNTMLAQNFNDYFENKTLRIDYLFSGNKNSQQIYLDELSSLPVWAGRRHHLTELPLAGNGDIMLTDKTTGKVIYRTSFSSLFQEWLGEEEATRINKGFENSFLVPFPKKEAIVTINLYNPQQRICASLTHEIQPDDILIRERGKSSITPHKYLINSGHVEQCIDIAILAEGYTESEMELFYKDAEATCEALFSHAPFDQFKERFNVVAVASPSIDSGVSVPLKGEWKSTAVHSHFSTFYSDRYLTTNRVKSIHNWLSGIAYEHIIILANTDTYGGGGIYNSYTLTTAHHPKFKPVVVHEFGHSFGGLADEYAYSDEPCPLYPYSLEPWEPNITTLANFERKWKNILPEGTKIPTPITQKQNNSNVTSIGVYEGAGYTNKGIYRPTPDCRMRTNEAPAFCPVCQHALEQLIRFYTEQ